MKAILRPSRDAVSPVVAEILMIAITVVLAAVLFLMASGLLNGNANIAPVVAFTGPNAYSGGSYNTTFSVADASRGVSIGTYKFNLRVGLLFGPATNFGTSGVPASITVNGTVYRVTWEDLDGGGGLTRGDQILVTGNGRSLPATTGFDFLLIWTDGSQITDFPWTTP